VVGWRLRPIGHQRLFRFLQDELLSQRLAVLSTSARHVPRYALRGSGIAMCDVDGLEYIDPVCGQMPNRTPKLSTPNPLSCFVGAQQDFRTDHAIKA
jgi:hypothetical protein